MDPTTGRIEITHTPGRPYEATAYTFSGSQAITFTGSTADDAQAKATEYMDQIQKDFTETFGSFSYDVENLTGEGDRAEATEEEGEKVLTYRHAKHMQDITPKTIGEQDDVRTSGNSSDSTDRNSADYPTLTGQQYDASDEEASNTDQAVEEEATTAASVTVDDVTHEDGEVVIKVTNNTDDEVTVWRNVGGRSGTKSLRPGSETLTYKAAEGAEVELRLDNEEGEKLI